MSRNSRTMPALAAGAVAALATVAIVAGQSASGWDLSWNAVTGGGGRSTSPGYELRGAIVPVVGNSSGGAYTVQGGFYGGDSIRFKRFAPVTAKDGLN